MLEREVARMRVLMDEVGSQRQRKEELTERILECEKNGDRVAEVEFLKELDRLLKRMHKNIAELTGLLYAGLDELAHEVMMPEARETADRIIAMIEGSKEDGQQAD